MAFSALEALQAFGMGRQMQMQERQMARQEALASRQETGRVRVGEQVRAGDFVGAAGTAFESGLGDEIPNIQHLDRAQQGQLQRETQAGLAAIDALERIQDDNQRGAFAQTLVGPLRQAGFDDREIAEYMQDLSIPTLQARRAYLTRLASGMGTQRSGGQPYRWRDNGGNLMEIGADGQPRRAYADPIPRMQWVRDPHTGREGWVTQPGAPAQDGQQSSMGGPQPGAIEDGYRFNGGDPADPNSWEPVGQGGAEQGAPATFPDQRQPVDGSAYPPGQW